MCNGTGVTIANGKRYEVLTLYKASFIAFLSLSNFALVRPRGLLFENRLVVEFLKYTLGARQFLLAFLSGHVCC